MITRFRAPLAVCATVTALSVVCLMVSRISPQAEPVVLDSFGYSISFDDRWATWGRRGVSSWEQIDSANALLRAGRPAKAVAAWEGIATAYREADVSVAQVATECIAVFKWKKGDIRGAIAAYTELLDTSARFETHRCHNMCCSLSDLHLLSGRTSEALRYLRMAQNRYPFRLWCGVATLNRQLALDARVEALELALQNGNHVILRPNSK